MPLPSHVRTLLSRIELAILELSLIRSSPRGCKTVGLWPAQLHNPVSKGCKNLEHRWATASRAYPRLTQATVSHLCHHLTQAFTSRLCSRLTGATTSQLCHPARVTASQPCPRLTWVIVSPYMGNCVPPVPLSYTGDGVLAVPSPYTGNHAPAMSLPYTDNCVQPVLSS